MSKKKTFVHFINRLDTCHFFFSHVSRYEPDGNRMVDVIFFLMAYNGLIKYANKMRTMCNNNSNNLKNDQELLIQKSSIFP